MKRNDKVTLCDSLAIIILSRLLKRNGLYVTAHDLETIETYIENGITTFTEKWLNNVITITGLTTNNRLAHTPTMLPYINTNEKVQLLMELLDKGDQHIFIRVEKGKVVCTYLVGDSMQELSFTVVANKENTKVFGLGHAMEDHGFSVHADYLNTLFGITTSKQSLYSYIHTSSRDGQGPTNASILTATRELYAYAADEINQRHAATGGTDYFLFFNRLANGLHTKYDADDDFEVEHCEDCKVLSLNYSALFPILQVIKIDVRIGEKKTPILKILDSNTGKLIFQIKMKSVKNEDSPTGRKYLILFQHGDILSFIMNNKTEKV